MCMHVCVRVCVYACVFVCMYVCMYVCVCVSGGAMSFSVYQRLGTIFKRAGRSDNFIDLAFLNHA